MAILNKLRSRFDLRYAVTEILLISIAILLALAIDQWWQNRSDRLAETDYLSRLESEARQNLQVLEFWASKMEEKRSFIVSLIDGDLESLLEEEASDLWGSFNVSSLPCFPPLQSASFSELMSTGRLGLLRDVEIRRELVNFDAQFKVASDAANRNTPLAYNALVFSRVSPDVAYDAAVLGEVEVSDIAAELRKMRDDPAFTEAATAEANYAISCIETLRHFQQRAQELQSLLQ